MGNPYRRTGASFAANVCFEPPLRQGDTAEIAVSIDTPAYRLGVREDLVGFLLGSGSELRDDDFNSRNILRPTERYEYRVVLPKALGATPLDPEVLRNGTTFADEREFIRSQPGAFTISQEEVEGEACWVMDLRRDNPPYRASYRLRWRLANAAGLGF